MNGVFKPFLDSFVIAFVENILVYLKSKKKHVYHLRLVLGVLREQKLNPKISEVNFGCL